MPCSAARFFGTAGCTPSKRYHRCCRSPNGRGAAPHRSCNPPLRTKPTGTSLPTRIPGSTAQRKSKAPPSGRAWLSRAPTWGCCSENAAKTQKGLSLSGHWGWSPCKSAWMERRNQCVGWNQSALMGGAYAISGNECVGWRGEGNPKLRSRFEI